MSLSDIVCVSLSGLTGQSFFLVNNPYYYYFYNMKEYFVYILSNFTNSTLYVGMTNDLRRRLYEHKNKLIPGFTEKYNVHKLVYYEITTDVKAAIQREKRLKKWNREWKIELIKKNNPKFNDLSSEWA